MQLGRIGIWSFQLWGERDEAVDAAAELDDLGFGAIWFPNGAALFDRSRDLLESTKRAVVAPGIASIWTHSAPTAAAAHHEITQEHPGRFLLGLGVSHPHLVDRDDPGRYSKPLTRMREYLDELDEAPTPVPPAERMLAALGPKMLELSRDRTCGAHPYLGTPEHTRRSREILGPDRNLAVEQGVVIEADPTKARQVARQNLAMYLQAVNYTNHWLRLGFTEGDFAEGGSDRLVDALVAWGGPDAIRSRVAEHHDAGADHVCIQVLTDDRRRMPREEWRELARMVLA